MRELRDYQVAGLEALRQTIRQGVKRIVLALPTRAGKTRCAAEIAAGALAKGNKLAFCVPRISLVDQTVEEFYQEDVRDVGVIQANHSLTDWSKPIQVCSIDTIRSKGVFPEASVVIIDECHVFQDAYKKWMAERPNTIFIGLSATPWSKGLGKYFETLLVMATTQELIEKKWLSPFKQFAAGHPDLSGVKIVAGEYHEGQLSDAMQKGSLTADIVDTWRSKWGKDRTLCFAVNCAHAKAIQERFEAAGIRCGYQDARTSPDERAAIKRSFHDSSLPVVVSVGTLTMGVTYDVRCISFCRPTRSEMTYVQIIGRGLAPAPDKDHLVILDHTDSWQKLGFVSDIYHDHLDGGKETGKAERKEPLPKECKSCGILKPPRTAVCPNCGFTAKPVNGIYEDDGELVEVTKGVATKKEKKRQYTMAEKADFYAQLKSFCQTKGYKEGWASNKYREKFDGKWPDYSIRDIAPKPPDLSTLMWIKSRQIAFAKSKGAIRPHVAGEKLDGLATQVIREGQ